MEENKVTLKLEEYDKLKDTERDYLTLIELLFEDTEKEGEVLKLDYYYSRITKFIKVKFPERYKERIKELQKRDEE